MIAVWAKIKNSFLSLSFQPWYYTGNSQIITGVGFCAATPLRHPILAEVGEGEVACASPLLPS